MNDLTVIYYTNNREKTEFAQRIRETLLEAIDGLPLISVSQKPLDFGENICVGDVGSSAQNVLRQIQIGAMAAKTKFIATAEADCLYPREHFLFRPPTDDQVYCARPMWCIMARKFMACIYTPKRLGCLGAAMMHRENAIRGFEAILKHLGKWGDADEGDERLPAIMPLRRGYFTNPFPIVTFKTNEGLHQGVPKYSGQRRDLEFWGPAGELKERYLYGQEV